MSLSVPAISEEDLSPPVLLDCSFAPSSVDTTSGPVPVTFTAHIRDDISGLQLWSLVLASPSGAQTASGFITFPYGSPVSGTLNDGIFELPITIPQYAESGTWTISQVQLRDNVGNIVDYSTTQLAALGFPTSLRVTSTTDVTPPVPVSFDFEPKTIDTSNAAATVTFTARITDDLSGLQLWSLVLASPSGAQTAFGFITFPYGSPVSGTLNDGIFELPITIPQYAESGTWTVAYMGLRDKAGNGFEYLLDNAQLRGLGFPTEFTVTSTPDVTPPVPVSFDFEPKTIDTSSAAATVTFTARITDDISGLQLWSLILASPSGAQNVFGFITFPYGSPVSGTLNDGIFELPITIPQYAESGTWTVAYVGLRDKAGNGWEYLLDNADLRSLGFPTELTNDVEIIPVQIDIKPGSFPNSINLGSKGKVPVAIFTTATFDAARVDPVTVTLAGATVALRGKGLPMASIEDVNGDGLLDMIVQVETEALQLSLGDTQAILEGKTIDGMRIRGSDSIRVVP